MARERGEKVGEIKRRRDMFHLLVHPLTGYNSQSGSRLEMGTLSFFQVSNTRMGAKPLGFSLLHSQIIRLELARKWSGQDGDQFRYGMPALQEAA